MGRRRLAREHALQMLFQIDHSGGTPDETFQSFWRDCAADEPTRAFAEDLVRGVRERREELDATIVAAAEHWRLERMPIVDRNLLRLAVLELTRDRATPAAVVIDEAVEIAKRFGGEDSAGFVNGVLDAIRRNIELAC